MFSTVIGSFSTRLGLRISGIKSMFITGRKELRKPIEISTAEFVVELNGIA
jgi:uncharacterized Fe-S cluster-containing radical SAM superfamily protein